jgi:hypothetical protein
MGDGGQAKVSLPFPMESALVELMIQLESTYIACITSLSNVLDAG